MSYQRKHLQNAIRLAPLALSIVMMMVHIFFIERFNADTWKFAGWRMFSKVSEKILVFHGVATNGETYKISVPANLEIRKAESFPTAHQLQKTLESISDKRVLRSSDGFEVINPKDALLNFDNGVVSAEPLDKWMLTDIFQTISVTVWDLNYNSTKGELKYVKSASETRNL